MKRILLSALAVCIMGVGSIAYGQSTRTVLVEHFTQASCGPCATNNPTLEATLNANAGTVVAIKHQVSWPGFDSMYEAYPAGPNNRVSHYGITGVPNTVMDGTSGPGMPNTVVTNSTIASAAAIPASFDIVLNAYIDPATSQLYVDMDITCTQAETGNLKAYIAVVEKHLTSVEEPGGSNGETDFYNVLRQYLPSPNGTTLSSSFTVSQTESVNESWDFSNGKVSDYCDLAVVAFIQDATTDEVFQAARVDVSLSPAGPLDGAIESFINLPTEICDGNYAPELKLINWGSTTMTSASIDYDINGGSAQNYNWSGSLPTCAQTTVTLPNYSFTVTASNTLNADIMTVNGSTDVNVSNNNATDVIAEAPPTDYEVQLTINTDDYADELWWEITDGTGTIIASDGNENVQGNYNTGSFPPPSDPTSPLQNRTTYNWTIPLSAVDCYTFTIYDYYGDGMLGYGGAPDGDWRLKDNTGATLGYFSGNYGGSALQLFKNNSAATSVIEIDLANSMNVYPNPFTNNATVEFNLSESAEVSFNVFNMLGEIVHAENMGTLEGLNLVNFNGSDLENGMYFFHLTANGKTITKRVTLAK